MASNYPNALDNFGTTHVAGEIITPGTDNDQADALNKIEAELGLHPSGSNASVAERFAAGDFTRAGAGKGWVNHGTNANIARPGGFASIEWRGSVQPVNMTTADTWVETSRLNDPVTGGGGSGFPRIVNITTSGSGVINLNLNSDPDVLFIINMNSNCICGISGLAPGASFTIEVRVQSGGNAATLNLPGVLFAGLPSGGVTLWDNGNDPDTGSTNIHTGAINIYNFYSPDGVNLRGFVVGENMAVAS